MKTGGHADIVGNTVACVSDSYYKWYIEPLVEQGPQTSKIENS